MTAQAIGSLFVSLGLDTALFTAGMKNATSGMGKWAGKLQSIGTGLSAAITAPLMGLAASAQIAANNLGELDNQARISGLSAQEFKVLALASESFGVQQEKVADILKDVNDKMGDFMQTGAGPLADFFENIAPKVGVTADQFRNLNSADALALYVSSLEKANLSQAEMTFYMEAIASDAAALLPVFSDNAKALKAMEAEAARLGLRLDGDLIATAKATADQFRITRDVLGIQFQQALVQLAPAVSELMGAIIPLITKLAGGVTWLAESFAALSPETQGFIAAAVGIAAVAGPAILGLGLAIPAVTGLATAFAALAMAVMANPLVAFIAAIAAGAALIYLNWDGIADYFAALWETVKFSVQSAWTAIDTAMNNGLQKVQEVQTSIEVAFVDGWNAIIAYLQGLPARFVEMGGQIVDGLKAGILAKWNEMVVWFNGLADDLVSDFQSWFDINSPSRVFREIGKFITQGLGLGLKDGVPGVESAMQGVADAVGGVSLTEGLYSFRDAARNVFSQVALQGKNLGDVLRTTLGNWFGNAANSLFNAGFDALWGAIGLPSFANGTNDFAGGLARVNERGGEIMNLPSGTQIIPHDVSMRMASGMGGGRNGMDVTITMDPSTGAMGAFVTDRAGQVVARARPAIVADSVRATYSAAKEVPIG